MYYYSTDDNIYILTMNSCEVEIHCSSSLFSFSFFPPFIDAGLAQKDIHFVLNYVIKAAERQ